MSSILKVRIKSDNFFLDACGTLQYIASVQLCSRLVAKSPRKQKYTTTPCLAKVDQIC